MSQILAYNSLELWLYNNINPVPLRDIEEVRGLIPLGLLGILLSQGIGCQILVEQRVR